MASAAKQNDVQEDSTLLKVGKGIGIGLLVGAAAGAAVGLTIISGGGFLVASGAIGTAATAGAATSVGAGVTAAATLAPAGLAVGAAMGSIGGTVGGTYCAVKTKPGESVSRAAARGGAIGGALTAAVVAVPLVLKGAQGQGPVARAARDAREQEERKKQHEAQRNSVVAASPAKPELPPPRLKTAGGPNFGPKLLKLNNGRKLAILDVLKDDGPVRRGELRRMLVKAHKRGLVRGTLGAALQHVEGHKVAHLTQEERAVRLYTSDAVYRAVGEALSSNDEETLKLFAPLLRGARGVMAKESLSAASKVTLHRATYISGEQLGVWKATEGKAARLVNFFSTTRREAYAKRRAMHVTKGAVLHITIPKGINIAAADIKRLSMYKGEDEVYFGPALRVRVTKVDEGRAGKPWTASISAVVERVSGGGIKRSNTAAGAPAPAQAPRDINLIAAPVKPPKPAIINLIAAAPFSVTRGGAAGGAGGGAGAHAGVAQAKPSWWHNGGDMLS